MYTDNQITAGSLAILRAGRALFGTFRGDGAFVALATRTVIPVLAGDVFASRGNVTNAAVRRGSALLTGSSMSIASLDLRAKATYIGFADAIQNASVFDNTDQATKAALITAVGEFYGIES